MAAIIAFYFPLAAQISFSSASEAPENQDLQMLLKCTYLAASLGPSDVMKTDCSGAIVTRHLAHISAVNFLPLSLKKKKDSNYGITAIEAEGTDF